MNVRRADTAGHLKIAQNPETSLDVLATLVRSENVEVRQAIALNPNASETLLRQLSEEFPEEIIQNPVLGILALENPGSSFVYLAKARSTATSPDTLAMLYQQSNDFEVLIAVCQNPNTPAHLFQSFVEDPPDLYTNEDGYDDNNHYEQLFSAIAENTATPPAILRIIYEKHRKAQCAIACNPNAPIDILENLSKSRYFLHLLKNPALPAHIVGRALIEKDETTRIAAQAHPNQPENANELYAFINEKSEISSELLEELSVDERLHVRLLVAKNRNTSPHALEQLVTDQYPDVVSLVSIHPNANEVILEVVAMFWAQRHITSLEIRQTAARVSEHPQVTEKALTTLIEGIPGIDADIAKMETVSAATLIFVAKKTTSLVTCRALANNPASPSQALLYAFMQAAEFYQPPTLVFPPPVRKQSQEERRDNRHRGNILVAIAKHAHLSELLFSRFLTIPELLFAVAGNPHLTNPMLDQLIATHNEDVLVCLAENNPHLTTHTIEQLIATRNKKALIGLAKNIYMPPDILMRLSNENAEVRASLAENEILSPVLVESLANDSALLVRCAIAHRTSLPVKLLQKLSQDDNERVCGCVAKNYSATTEILEEMTHHSSVHVKTLLANHEKATQQMLLTLAEEDSPEIRINLSRRKDLSESIIRMLFRKSVGTGTIKLEKAKQGNEAQGENRKGIDFRGAIIGRQRSHPKTPQANDSRANYLKKLEKEIVPLLAEHPNTPQDLRKHLK